MWQEWEKSGGDTHTNLPIHTQRHKGGNSIGSVDNKLSLNQGWSSFSGSFFRELIENEVNPSNLLLKLCQSLISSTQ